MLHRPSGPIGAPFGAPTGAPFGAPFGTAGLRIRPIQYNARNRWVSTGVSWRDLRYGYYTAQYRPEQLEALRGVADLELRRNPAAGVDRLDRARRAGRFPALGRARRGPAIRCRPAARRIAHARRSVRRPGRGRPRSGARRHPAADPDHPARRADAGPGRHPAGRSAGARTDPGHGGRSVADTPDRAGAAAPTTDHRSGRDARGRHHPDPGGRRNPLPGRISAGAATPDHGALQRRLGAPARADAAARRAHRDPRAGAPHLACTGSGRRKRVVGATSTTAGGFPRPTGRRYGGPSRRCWPRGYCRRTPWASARTDRSRCRGTCSKGRTPSGS